MFGSLLNPVNTLLNSKPVKDFLNKQVGAYAEIENLNYSKGTLEATARILGMNESITVKVEEFEVAEDCSWFAIRKVSASAEGIENLCNAFLVNREFTIPEDKRGLISPVRMML